MRGFCNWKDGTLGIRSHESSACHADAVETVVTLPSTTVDVGELSHQYARQKVNNRHALYQIFTSIKYLSRQGLSLRGDRDESDGNLSQLLRMKANDVAILMEWLKRKENIKMK